MEPMEALTKNLAIIAGRVNALHTTLSVIARSLPPAIAGEAHAQLSRAAEAVTADAIAAPIPDLQLFELQRVLLEMVGVLDRARRE